LSQLSAMTLDATVTRHDTGDKCLLDLTLHNPGPQVALMTHVQLRREQSGERVLPVYYTDNYVSLAPQESRTLTVEAALADLKGEKPLLVVDGWNINVKPIASTDADVTLNENAQVSHWPVTHISVYYGEPSDTFRVRCSGDPVGDFQTPNFVSGGNPRTVHNAIDTSAPMSGPQEIYQIERWGGCTYRFPMKPLPAGHTYTVRLHFAETSFDAAGKRKFNAAINGQRVLTNFDIYQEAGGKDKAIVKEFTGITPNNDGLIEVHVFDGSVDRATINAIEVFDPGK
jgi:hypothetical protein